MTLDKALALETVALDHRLEVLRQRFEDSLITNHAPPDMVEDLWDFHEEHQRTERARALREIRARLVAELAEAP